VGIVFVLYVRLQFAVEVLDLIKEALPVATAAAKLASSLSHSQTFSEDASEEGEVSSNTDAVSKSAPRDLVGLHYATVETDHPYKQSAVSHFKVSASVVYNVARVIITVY